MESINTERNLTFVFDISVKLKISIFSNPPPEFAVTSAADTKLSDLYNHLEVSLKLSNKEALAVLPIAVCRSRNSQQRCTRLPLVSEHIWRYLLDNYPFDVVRVVLEKRPPVDLTPPRFASLRRKELKVLDLSYYVPEQLEREHLVALSEEILYQDCHIKPKLRRGLWMHLLGVFHPGLKSLEQRETYIGNLRRVYDNLKGKLGDKSTWSPQIRHLRDSIQRDAVRTDPSEEFLADPSAMEKIVDIVTVYTLEHSEIKYTQGMTDLLSPLLYTMKQEADTYICFAAMFERIKVNFTEWCEGTLNKLERLKHLCEVLDPELFKYLSEQQLEDPFVLFFGMVLIECRREFNFEGGLHLLEVLWAAALRRDSPSLKEISQAKWASFMTSVSTEIVDQTFGEARAPYSTRPLEEDSMDFYVSPETGSSPIRHLVSNARLIPRPGSASVHSEGHSKPDSLTPSHNSSPLATNGGLSPSSPSRVPMKRSMSLPDNSYIVVESNSLHSNEVKSEGNLHSKTEEEELQDSVGELGLKQLQHIPQATEMTDMSSVSSSTTAPRNSNSLSCSSENPTSTKDSGNDSSKKEGNECAVNREDFLHGSLEIENSTVEDHGDNNEEKDGPSSSSTGNQRKALTLPRRQQNSTCISDVSLGSTTLPRVRSSLPPAPFLHHLSRPSMSSPYVSSIRALDPRISYPNAIDTDPFKEDNHASLSPRSSPQRFSRLSRSPSSTHSNGLLPASPLPFARSSSSQQQPMAEPMSASPFSIDAASIEVSHVMSELMSGEHTHPNVNRETSLQIRMADAFSLFVCLAILIRNRHAILTERMDFITISMLLNNQTESQSLPQILKIARQLHQIYYSYQMTCFYSTAASGQQRDAGVFETWIDDPSHITIATREE